MSETNPLIGRERIRGATRVIPEGTDAKNVTADQIEAVIIDTELFLRQFGLFKRDVAKACGYSDTTISNFMKRKPGCDSAQIAIALDDWLVEESDRRAVRGTTQFVWSNVAMLIKSVGSYLIDHNRMGLVYGPDSSGIGKTMAVRAIAELLGPRRCTLVTVDKVDANPTGLLRKILQAMREESGGSDRKRFLRLVKKLQGGSHVLLIDQIHNLRFSRGDKPFYYLTDLFDATNAPQLWCGTADMVSYLNRQREKTCDESLAQIRSRFSLVIDLMEGTKSGGSAGGGEPLVTVEQIKAMFARNKLRLTDSAARFLARIANQPDSGGLRLCVSIVQYATVIADQSALGSIDTPVLQLAMARCFGTVRADLLAAKMEPERPATIARAG